MNATTLDDAAKPLVDAAVRAVRVSERAADGFVAILDAEDIAAAHRHALTAMSDMRHLMEDGR